MRGRGCSTGRPRSPRARRWLALAALLVVGAGPFRVDASPRRPSTATGAQGGARDSAPPATLPEDFPRRAAAAAGDPRPAELRPPPCLEDPVLGADTSLLRACARAYEGYYTYQAEAYRLRSRSFRWQLTSTWITFVVVIFLVLSGVYFSWLQFRAELPRRPAPRVVERVEAREGAAGQPGGAADAAQMEPVVHTRSVTQLKASTSGVEVSSPVLGVIILALSLMFFYLYLKYVYPITETF